MGGFFCFFSFCWNMANTINFHFHVFSSQDAITAMSMTFTEGQISTIKRTDGIKIPIQVTQEKEEKRSLPRLDENFIFPHCSLKLAELRATRADWGKSIGARHADTGSWHPSLPSWRRSLLPQASATTFYPGHLIRCMKLVS